jgi:hypothetical protein
MKTFLAALSLLSATFGFSQEELVQFSYTNASLSLGGSTVVLNSDGVFFLASYTCTDMYVTTGKWTKNRNKLILKGFDSLASLPNVIIEKKKSNSDSVKIYAVDYLNEPYKGLSVDLYRADGSFYSGEETDSTGYLTFSKKDFAGFMISFQAGDMMDDATMYDFSKGETEFRIKTNYPNLIYLDRPLHFEKLKSQTYLFKDDGLYKGRKKIFKLS